MSKNWPRVRLGELLKRVKEEINVEDEQTYARLTIRMKGNGIVLRDRVPGHEIGTKKQFVARAGQLVLSKIDARNGAFGILLGECDKAIITGNFWAFDADKDRLLPAYFDYLTKTPLFVEFCVRASEGTTNRLYLQEDQFLAQEVMLPPLAEQRQIVARIDELSAEIDEARGLRKQATDEAEALIVSTHLRFAGPRTRKLSDLVTLDECQVGVTPTGEYPQVGVRGFGGGLFPKGSVLGTDTTYRAFNQLYEGALVLSQVKGWEGAVGVCGSTLAGWFVSPEYRTFRCVPSEARPDYLATLVRTEWFWGRLKDVTRGVGARRERTRPEQFLDLQMPMPDLEQQEAGKRIFADVRTLKIFQAETLTELDVLMPSILDKAFRGEL